LKIISIRETLINCFLKAGIERPNYTADIIISNVLSISRAKLITKMQDELSEQNIKNIFLMSEERLQKRPLSYILGESEFYGRIFKVGEGCFIPRPETELLIEALLSLAPNAELFADWCTGSACIGITLLLENPKYKGYGIDSSDAALKWAQKNANLYSLNERITFICEQSPSKCTIKENSLDFIISNPPYIPTSKTEGLMKDVRDYEPREALDGGEEGIDVLLKIVNNAPRLLKPAGYIALETDGDEQIEKIIECISADFKIIKKIYDYNNIMRHLVCQLK